MGQSFEGRFASPAPPVGLDDELPVDRLRQDAIGAPSNLPGSLKASVKHHQSSERIRRVHTSDGAVVDIAGDGKILDIHRTDGTAVDFGYKGNRLNKITEHRAQGHVVEWNKDANADRWRSMSYIGALRLNFHPNRDGSITFGATDGTNYTTFADGTQRRVTENNSRILLDPGGKVTNVERPDGSQVYCGYTGDTLSHVTEKNGNQFVDWTKQPDGRWTAPGSSEVRRDYSVSPLGNLAYVSTNGNDVVTIQYSDGNERNFTWNNGKVNRIDEHTPDGIVTWTRQGNSNDWASGQAQEKRSNVSVSPDGDYSYIDPSGFKHVYPFDDTEDKVLSSDLVRTTAITKAHNDLVAAEQRQIGDKQQQSSFEKDLDTFERRSATSGLTEQQIVDTESEVGAILESKQNQPALSQSDRIELAKEVLHHVAMPRSIDQGDHNTCGAAVAEVVVAQRHPEKFADVIRQVADTGQYVSTGGFTVALDNNSLQPDWEARDFAINPYNPTLSERSFASQLYQVAGINSAYLALNRGLIYEQRAPKTPNDTGETTVDEKTGALKSFTDGLYPDEVESIIKQTSAESVPVLVRGTHFSTLPEFQTKLGDLQMKGQLPVPMWVDTKKEPFWTATGKGRGGGGGGGHFITLWDLDATKRVLVDNQWGRSGDYESLKRMPLNTLFNAGG